MKSIFTIMAVCCATFSMAQNAKMDFEKYEPNSTLVVPEHKITRAKFPFIDVHNHQFNMPSQDVRALLKQMDELNMRVMVNLSGRGFKSVNGQFGLQDPQYLADAIANAKKATPNRIIHFTNVSFIGVGEPGWTEKAVKELENDVKAGANGLKVYKNLGFSFKDNTGKLLRIDDPRLDPIWAKCGELKLPVLIHSADPEPFWQALDDKNERWLELATRPDRKRSDTDPAPWSDLIQQQHNIIKRHPKTNFIAAHFGWYPNNLAKLGSLLDAMPNMYVEFGAVIAELGRQPRMAKAFFEKYQDRIMFGKDSWVPEEYATYFRVLETTDEYFPYHKKYHAFWRMYGMGLSDDVLKKVYYKNALRLIPNIDKTLFPDEMSKPQMHRLGVM
ncbi:MAG: amidohydrolase family protein, partial [Chitinophagaceae bacterium]|nr:amidohydrolase family protein [Chitinophagaceae bacterium]